MGNINDTLVVNIIFFILFTPFILFFEMLVFQSQGSRRFLILGALFLILLALYWVIHPAPKVARNFLMTPPIPTGSFDIYKQGLLLR